MKAAAMMRTDNDSGIDDTIRASVRRVVQQRRR
jgi:hypothetical protein